MNRVKWIILPVHRACAYKHACVNFTSVIVMVEVRSVLPIVSSSQTFTSQLLRLSGQIEIAKNTVRNMYISEIWCLVKMYECRANFDLDLCEVLRIYPLFSPTDIHMMVSEPEKVKICNF